jgi:hypothetical protein
MTLFPASGRDESNATHPDQNELIDAIHLVEITE